jgi:hypothetical protein
LGDGHREEGRQADEQAVGADRVHAGQDQQRARGDPDDPVRTHEQAVLPEAARAGQASSEEVADGVARERQEQAAEQDPVVVEQLGGEERADEDEDRADDAEEAEGQQAGLLQDREAALAEGSAMGQRAPHLLLDREEEPGSEDERREPQLVDRSRRVRAQPVAGERQEAVGREAGDHETDSDRDSPFGHQGPEVARHAPGRDR